MSAIFKPTQPTVDSRKVTIEKFGKFYYLKLLENVLIYVGDYCLFGHKWQVSKLQEYKI